MMRVCHLNTCPVGIATQDPALRKQFAGTPENVVAFFFFLAEEVRELMAELGFANMDDMVGRIDMLDTDHAIEFYKAKGLDLTPILTKPDVSESVAVRCVSKQDHGLDVAIDHDLIRDAEQSLQPGSHTTTSISRSIRNRDRTVGAMLSGKIAGTFGPDGLPDDTINISFTGSAGQSFGAFLVHGVTMKLEGDSNDYLGKGLSGGKIIVHPPKDVGFNPAENIVAGNTLLYGATAGQVYLNGIVGERFAVRNSGAHAIVEGTGDHGCEYMTGGVVVVLGATGRNFAAGMSGGIAYVWNPDKKFESRCNLNNGLTVLESVVDKVDEQQLRSLIEKHQALTGSERARVILADWSKSVKQFVKVVSLEYRRAQAEQEKLREPALA